MTQINWNDGRLITLHPGDEADCQFQLHPGQLYALALYNASADDNDVTVSVKYLAGAPDVAVLVPRPSVSLGTAVLCFVSGDETESVSAKLPDGEDGDAARAVIASVSMPINTAGFVNLALSADGEPQAFAGLTRYFDVLNLRHYDGLYQGTKPPSLVIQFVENAAIVTYWPDEAGAAPPLYYAGQCEDQVVLQATSGNSSGFTLTGDNMQHVFLNLSGTAQSKNTTLTLTGMPTARFSAPEVLQFRSKAQR